MDKRYQVFVSSTYADLQQERQKVIQALMEMDCIPAGMELFPAADEEQWEFIKRIIDDCDYYLLIIGGRYGSLTPEGISYTEQEYNYAASVGLKVLALIHERPEDIPVGKSDIDPVLRAKLDAFRDTVSTGRLVKFWRHASELPGLVALSLAKTMKLYPAVGWVRASHVGSDELLGDLNQLRKENEALRTEIVELKPEKLGRVNLAGLDEVFELHLTWRANTTDRRKSVSMTWSKIFGSIAAEMTDHPNDEVANKRMAAAIHRMDSRSSSTPYNLRVDHDDFQTIRLQLTTLGLVRVKYNKSTSGKMAMFWTLTERGSRLLIELRTVKSSQTTVE